MKFYEEMFVEDKTIKNSINTVIQEIDRKNRRLVNITNELNAYKKALDKACKLLDERLCTCPYDCFDLYGTQWEANKCKCNCNDEYEKCWKEYLLKESEGNND